MSPQVSSMLIRGRAGLAVNRPNEPVPPGWVWVPVNSVARQETGHTPSRSHPEWWGGDIPWIGIRDARLHHGGVIHDTLQTTNPLGLANSSARLLPKGTVCLSRTASVGYVTIMGRDMATSQDFVTWTCSEALVPEFLVKALIAEGEGLRKFGKGTTHTTIYFPEIRALHICLPPLAEQKRIVAKLDALNAKSARARTELARIETLVSRYKQAVLSKAFAAGVNELISPITAIGDIADVTKGASPKWQGFDYQESGIRFIRSQNVGWGELLLDDEAFLDERFNLKQRNSVIEENDVLLNIVGASIGRTAVADRRLVGANCNQAVALVKPKKRMRASSDYLCYWFQSPIAQGAIRDGSVDVARANFSLGEIKKLTLPWPSDERQHEIVRRIESAFAKIDRLAKEAKRALELVGRLDEAILAKAFRGELVPQNESDEPAVRLLARIRAEREAAPKGKRHRT